MVLKSVMIVNDSHNFSCATLMDDISRTTSRSPWKREARLWIMVALGLVVIVVAAIALS